MSVFALLKFDTNPIEEAMESAVKNKESFDQVRHNLQLQQPGLGLSQDEVVGLWRKSVRINQFKMNRLSFSDKPSSRRAWELMKKQLEDLHASLNPTDEERLRLKMEEDEYWERKQKQKKDKLKEMDDDLDEFIASCDQQIEDCEAYQAEVAEHFSNLYDKVKGDFQNVMSAPRSGSNCAEQYKMLDAEQRLVSECNKHEYAEIVKKTVKSLKDLAQQKKDLIQQHKATLEQKGMDRQQILQEQKALSENLAKIDEDMQTVKIDGDKAAHATKQNETMDRVRQEMFRGNHYDPDAQPKEIKDKLKGMKASETGKMLVGRDACTDMNAREGLHEFRGNSQSVFAQRQAELAKLLHPTPSPDDGGATKKKELEADATPPPAPDSQVGSLDANIPDAPALPLPSVPDFEKGTPGQVDALDIAQAHLQQTVSTGQAATAALNAGGDGDSIGTLQAVSVTNQALSSKQSGEVASLCSQAQSSQDVADDCKKGIKDVVKGAWDKVKGALHLGSERSNLVDAVADCKGAQQEVTSKLKTGMSALGDKFKSLMKACGINTQALSDAGHKVASSIKEGFNKVSEVAKAGISKLTPGVGPD